MVGICATKIDGQWYDLSTGEISKIDGINGWAIEDGTEFWETKEIDFPGWEKKHIAEYVIRTGNNFLCIETTSGISGPIGSAAINREWFHLEDNKVVPGYAGPGAQVPAGEEIYERHYVPTTIGYLYGQHNDKADVARAVLLDLPIRFENLTPHPVRVRQYTFPKSDNPVRLDEKKDQITGTTLGKYPSPVYKVEYGRGNLPPRKKYTGYIVSQMVAAAFPNRDDLYYPGDMIRDDQGRITGCESLYQIK